MEPEPEHGAADITLASYARLVRRNRNVRRLWLAQIVSEIGDWFYSVAIFRRSSAKLEAQPELSLRGKHVHRYTFQQLLLLVPLAVPALAFYQEWQRSKRGSVRSG